MHQHNYFPGANGLYLLLTSVPALTCRAVPGPWGCSPDTEQPEGPPLYSKRQAGGTGAHGTIILLKPGQAPGATRAERIHAQHGEAVRGAGSAGAGHPQGWLAVLPGQEAPVLLTFSVKCP